MIPRAMGRSDRRMRDLRERCRRHLLAVVVRALTIWIVKSSQIQRDDSIDYSTCRGSTIRTVAIELSLWGF